MNMTIANWEELKGKAISVIMTNAKCNEAIVEDVVYLNSVPYLLLNVDNGAHINTNSIVSFIIIGETIKEEEDIKLDSDLSNEEEDELMDETADEVYKSDEFNNK